MSLFITPSQFQSVLRRTAPWLLPVHLSPLRIGVCVSGGPDSMALAYLLHNLDHPEQGAHHKWFSVHAFIVDHSVRSGSDTEAKNVATNLSQLGIMSTIRTLHWTEQEVMARSSMGYEENLRERRYPAIATAGSQLGIRHYFTGHHRDDQVETLMMRLIRDKTFNLSTLQGIQEYSSMPCCSHLPLSKPHARLRQGFKLQKSHELFSSAISTSESLSTLGHLVHRPLLCFSKQELVSTCEHYEIPYVHDKTNDDPQLTTRNAIRALRKNYVLPRALSAEKLLEMQSSAISRRENITGLAHQFLRNASAVQIFSHLGVARVELPLLPRIDNMDEVLGFSYFLARCVELVSPAPADMAFGKLRTKDAISVVNLLQQAVSSGRKDPMKLLSCRKTVIEARFSPHSTLNRHGRIQLFFYRQVMSVQELERTTTYLKLHQMQSDWILWDERYWIRIFLDKSVVSKNNELTIRSMSGAKFGPVLNMKDGFLHLPQDSTTRKLIKTVPKMMWQHIPVVVLNGEIVDFPTLGFGLRDSESGRKRVTCELRIRRSLRSSDFFYRERKSK